MVDLVKNGKLNDYFTPQGKLVEGVKTSIREYATGSVTYFGKTAMGFINHTGSEIWQVLRIVETASGSDNLYSYADGNELYDNIWDDKESLDYV